MSTLPDWPVAFFDDDYLRMYRPQFTPERTDAEITFIERALGLAAGARVLDLACGYGRHAIVYVQQGWRHALPGQRRISGSDGRQLYHGG